MESLEQIIEHKKGQKGQLTYFCETCDYACCKIYNWDRHLLTSKHINRINLPVLEHKGQNISKCSLGFNSYLTPSFLKMELNM